MHENNTKQEIKTPISVMLEMAKNELGTHVLMCMEKNSIPPDLMVYVLKSILLDVTEAKTDRMSEEYVALQASMNQQEVADNGVDGTEGIIR